MAVTFVRDKVQHQTPPGSVQTGGGQQNLGNGQMQAGQREVRGARSVAYSLAAYIFGAPSAQMWLLCAVQALATGFLCAVTLLLFGGDERRQWWKLAVLAAATPVAFVVCLAIPDIFAGLVILAIALLATGYARMSHGVRTVTVFIAATGIAFHASHLPIGLAMTATAMSWMAFAAWRRTHIPRLQWVWVAAPFLLGAGATVACNLAAFGGASLTGKRYPLTLARSVAEGPGKWYLEKNCKHLNFAICEVYPHGVPGTVDSFLWGPNGVKQRATPEQLDRIRTEESDVVLAATRAYPLVEFERVGRNFAWQLVRFEPGVGLLNSRIVLDSTSTPQLAGANYSRFWTSLVHWLTAFSVIASLVVLYRRFRSDPSVRPVIALIVAGILFNDAVCVYFSGIVDRYGARTIWLLPLLALALLERSRGAEARAA